MRRLSLLFFCLFLSSVSGFAQMAKTNGIEVWYETFGKKEDSAVLLVMGGGCQGIHWPTEFCRRLAAEGLYVIRYDHRDTGLSTCFDFAKAPYDMLDLTRDAIGLLDAIGVQKAHWVGLSMGGPIAQLAAVHFKERVTGITLMATSCDMEASVRACEGLAAGPNSLSPPNPDYVAFMKAREATFKAKTQPPTISEQVDQSVEGWRMLSGSMPFDEERYQEIWSYFFYRARHLESMWNHLLAIKQSYNLIRTIPYLVEVPTLILQGSADPIFGPDHGQALAKAIQGSRYMLVEGMGHLPNAAFYDLWCKEIKYTATLSACSI